MTTRSVPWLLALMGLAACGVDQDLGQADYSQYEWPGMNDPDADPWDFQGRIDAELCDGEDNDGDGSIDEGCTGTCDTFVTRLPSWWDDSECVLDGDATGFSPFPIVLGDSEVYDSYSDVAAVMAADPGGDPKLKLRRHLLAMKLNNAYFNLGDTEVVDWNGDGSLEDVDWLIAKADVQYESGASWIRNVFAQQLKEMNNLGTDQAIWFDISCATDAEYCDGIDNDGDGSTDENCGCVETCGDSYDNDFDGSVDEGCSACDTLQTRTWDFWGGASCVIGGSEGFDMLPITLGSSETYTSASTVTSTLATSPGGDATARLRRQLLTAKLNRTAFNTGDFPAGDWDGDGTDETWDEAIAIADGLFDGGTFWRKIQMTTFLQNANESATDVAIWFRADCSTEAEFCDEIDNDGDGFVDEFCGCVEACDGYDNDFDGTADEDWPEGCPDEEICDGIDNDGDGEIDEADAVDASEWHYDGDGDGYGDPGVAVTACDAPVDYVADNTDCDDSRSGVNPGVLVDDCNGRDNDCDGDTDEDSTTWYRDSDSDGYGDPDVKKKQCDEPSGYVDDDQDCDDGDDGINPGAIDYCDDGIDQDCSGDEVGCYDPDLADTTFTGVSAGDGAGVAATAAGDVDSDGNADVVIGARYTDHGGADAGSAYLFYGPISVDGEVSLSTADLRIDGLVAGDYFGRTVIGGADIDGDGIDDVTVGAPNEDTRGTSAGSAYIFSGASLAAVSGSTMDASSADMVIRGRDGADYLGAHTSYSEISGDSTLDLLLSTTGDSVGGTNAGAVYMYAGPVSVTDEAISDGGWTARVLGENADDQLGLFVATDGDINGDGIGDVAFGVPRSDLTGTNSGTLYLVAGPFSGTIDLVDADVRVGGASAGDKLGAAIDFGGDQDGDGTDDLFVTAPFQDSTDTDAGTIYMVYGNSSLESVGGVGIEAVADATIRGKEKSGQLGSSIAASGDHDGDGTNDVVSGANNDGPDAEGAAYLFLGPISGTLSWADADYSFSGEAAFDHAGSFVGYGGGLRSGVPGDTLIIGAREADVGGAEDAGRVYLIFDAFGG